MVNRIDHTFAVLKKNHQKALIGYITAGYPRKNSFKVLVPLLERSGLDLLEVGVPFSDPIADGPTIQHASQVALDNGVTLAWILNAVKDLRKTGTTLPIILMSYCNPIHAFGIDHFFKTAKAAGVDGLIIPDMIPEESSPYSRSASAHGVDLIFLVAPTTPKNRIRQIAKSTRGFLYAVSVTGVTGARKSVAPHALEFLDEVKAVSTKPVAIGFGLSTPEQVRAMSRHGDGVIVGSALIRAIGNSKSSSFAGAARFVRSLAIALNGRKDNTHAS